MSGPAKLVCIKLALRVLVSFFNVRESCGTASVMLSLIMDFLVPSCDETTVFKPSRIPNWAQVCSGDKSYKSYEGTHANRSKTLPWLIAISQTIITIIEISTHTHTYIYRVYVHIIHILISRTANTVMYQICRPMLEIQSTMYHLTIPNHVDLYEAHELHA